MKMRSLFCLMMSLTIFGSICPLQVKAEKAEGEYLKSAIKSKQFDKTQNINSENQRDRKLEIAIINQSIRDRELLVRLPALPQYAYTKIDLNGDKKPEIIVHLVGRPFCGTGGCTTLIFTKDANGYKLLSEIGLNHPPIINAHQLRHTFATNLVISGMSPYHAMTLMRQKSFRNFRRYAKAAERAAAEAEFNKVSNGGSILRKNTNASSQNSIRKPSYLCGKFGS